MRRFSKVDFVFRTFQIRHIKKFLVPGESDQGACQCIHIPIFVNLDGSFYFVSTFNMCTAKVETFLPCSVLQTHSSHC